MQTNESVKKMKKAPLRDTASARLRQGKNGHGTGSVRFASWIAGKEGEGQTWDSGSGGALSAVVAYLKYDIAIVPLKSRLARVATPIACPWAGSTGRCGR